MIFAQIEESTRCSQPSSGARYLIFGIGLFVYFGPIPCFMCANSKGFGETAQMRRLAWAFAGRLSHELVHIKNPLSGPGTVPQLTDRLNMTSLLLKPQHKQTKKLSSHLSQVPWKLLMVCRIWNNFLDSIKVSDSIDVKRSLTKHPKHLVK